MLIGHEQERYQMLTEEKLEKMLTVVRLQKWEQMQIEVPETAPEHCSSCVPREADGIDNDLYVPFEYGVVLMYQDEELEYFY